MEGFRFTFLDAEVVTIELIVALLDRVTDHDFDYVHVLGAFYLTIRVGWYLYDKVRIIKQHIKDDNKKE